MYEEELVECADVMTEAVLTLLAKTRLVGDAGELLTTEEYDDLQMDMYVLILENLLKLRGGQWRSSLP